MWLAVFAVVTLTFTSRCCTSQPTHSASGIVFKCSADEMKPLQRYWHWMQHETTSLEKVTVYKAIMQSIAERQGEDKTGKEYAELYELQGTPIALTAYRLFSYIGMFINLYTSPDVYVSHAEHLIYGDYQSSRTSADNCANVRDAQFSVLDTIMDMADDKVTWKECWADIWATSRHIRDTYRFRASSAVTCPCGLARGHVNFTQSSAPGSTVVEIELEAESNRNYVVHINNENTCGVNVKDLKVVERNQTESADDKKLVRYNFESDQISVRGPDNVIGKTVVIYEAESDRHDSHIFVVNTETGPTFGKQIACGVIYLIY